ncbi:BLUF domain-containing protein [Alteromonas stellipolaris]|uniref:BLUF domain-containing protein n=1 Tax=Alteromonas stellipolaris TaxID=233316 RepID=UPI001DD5AFD5|nr:BLUF domain-containing protein [Alteromonas stellipolaris]MBZ2163515.1 BLUF domain-containing protein [Alteromonas stellipolaris]
MKNIVRLIYLSLATRDMSLSDMKDILTYARKNNQSLGICGMLCYDNRYFVQALEGEREAVNELFFHISDDARHSDVIITSYEYIDKPTFTEWNMGYASSTPIFTELLARLSQTEFEPTKLPPKQIYALLRHLSAHQQKV